MIRNIRVYKTNVDDRSKAELIIETIRRHFPGSDISFDLEDCDKVLRVANPVKEVDETKIRNILEMSGFKIESLI